MQTINLYMSVYIHKDEWLYNVAYTCIKLSMEKLTI
jgi:hypothetical protein